MQITLNDKESKEYLELKDKEVLAREIQCLLKTLENALIRLTPIYARYDKRSEITLEQARTIIRETVSVIEERMQPITQKHTP